MDVGVALVVGVGANSPLREMASGLTVTAKDVTELANTLSNARMKARSRGSTSLGKGVRMRERETAPLAQPTHTYIPPHTHLHTHKHTANEVDPMQGGPVRLFGGCSN